MRIIPARAGFTPPRKENSNDRPDHPRSRGVYGGRDGGGHDSSGSSPLARGLPRIVHVSQRQRRIIPARAGFTVCSFVVPYEPWDHPRSRGVYATTTWTAVIIPGSSPLARGLPSRDPDRQGTRGIIPARAGFTTAASTRSTPTRHHPRSRGVYLGWMGVRGRRKGSSPLARGLPMGAFRVWGSFGIIPARAGFTRSRPRRATIWPDHPRSRGVYQWWQ